MVQGFEAPISVHHCANQRCGDRAGQDNELDPHEEDNYQVEDEPEVVVCVLFYLFYLNLDRNIEMEQYGNDGFWKKKRFDGRFQVMTCCHYGKFRSAAV